MSRPWDDCRFFIINQCRNAACKFRHSEDAKGADVCTQWENGLCQNILCPYRHVVVKEKSSVPCHYERLPQGCMNPDCQFKHVKPRDTEAIDLQKKLAQFLAEHESSTKKDDPENGEEQKVENPENDRKRKVSNQSSSSEEDLAAMRAKMIQQQVKSKSNGIVKKVKIDTPPIDEEREVPKDVTDTVKRRIIAKSHYSEDEASDISLDELTDEEPEDLRATLNKSKKNKTRIVENDISTRQINKEDLREKRKITQKQTVALNRGGRIISIRKNKGRLGELSGGESTTSRPSSSEWIERKITVKKTVQESKRRIPNRLITNVKNSTRDVTSESEYSDTQSTDDSPRSKRKPNLSWVKPEDNGVKNRLGSKEGKEVTKDVDDPPKESKKVLSSRLDRFANSGIVRQVPNSSSRSGVRSRLGNVTEDAKRGVKSRLGEVRQINQTKPPSAINKSDKEEQKDEIPIKRKKLILIKKKKKVDEIEAGEVKDDLKEKTPPTNTISPTREPNMDARSPKKERRQSSSRSPSTKPTVERRQSRRRNSSNTSPPIRRRDSNSCGKSQKPRQEPLLSENLDDFEKELLDNPDNLYIDDDIDDDDLFDDL